MKTAHNFSPIPCDHHLFTAVLSSAYSLQQRHDRIRSQVRAARFNEIIGEVVSTHSLIRKRNLDLDTTLQLVVNRTQKLADAAGAAVALLEGEDLEYRVGTGLGATLLGLKVTASASVSFARLRSEACVETDTWQDSALARRLVAKVLTAPIYSRGKLAGCIQLFCRHGRFDCDGVHACELMASIVSQIASSDLWRPVEPIQRTALADECEPLEALRTELGLLVGAEDAGYDVRQDDRCRGGRSFERDLKKPAASTWARQQMPGTHFLQKSDNAGRDFPLVSYTGSRVPNPLSTPDDFLSATPAVDTPSKAIPRDFKLNHLSQHQAIPSPNEDPVKREVRRGKAWHSLSLIAYPAFVLIFAIVVRVNAGVHSWSLEVILYVLVVVTTLELRHRVLKQ